MISDQLRLKLEQLNRGPLVVGSPAPEVRSPTRILPVEELPGAREVVGGSGRFLLIERRLSDLLDGAPALLGPFGDVFVGGRHGFSDLAPDSDWARLLAMDPSRIVFLDIETLGLAGSPVFLIGLGHYADGDLVLHQLFCRDYAEEPHVLTYLAEHLNGCGAVVTFNGKAFDWPTLCDRAVVNRVARPAELLHLDLLHEARRRYRSVLPNCKLQTLEYHVCRRRRTGDIPGSLIPEVYHQFVRTGDATRMRDVVHHNALDVVTMVELLAFMAAGGELVWGD